MRVLSQRRGSLGYVLLGSGLVFLVSLAALPGTSTAALTVAALAAPEPSWRRSPHKEPYGMARIQLE